MTTHTPYRRSLDKSGMFAEIHRRGTGKDRLGQPKQEFALEESGIPCRVSYAGINASNYKSGEIMTERYIDVVGETRIVFLPHDVSVNEKDMIRVVNKDGDEVMPLTSIYSVRPRFDGRGHIHHKEAVTITTRAADFEHAGSTS